VTVFQPTPLPRLSCATLGEVLFSVTDRTHTYVVLELTPAAFNEIKAKLTAAGYQHAFITTDTRLLISMEGLAVASAVDKSVDCDLSGVRTSDDEQSTEPHGA